MCSPIVGLSRSFGFRMTRVGKFLMKVRNEHAGGDLAHPTKREKRRSPTKRCTSSRTVGALVSWPAPRSLRLRSCERLHLIRRQDRSQLKMRANAQAMPFLLQRTDAFRLTQQTRLICIR